MLTKQAKYAIRAVLYLSIYSNDKGKKLSSKEIAEKIDIPAPFLAKIFQKLSKNRLICSVKGPNGGFYMTQKELSKNLFDIIECIDGLENFNTCALGLPQCSDENPCAIHHIISPFKKQLTAELTGKTIAQFADETKKGKSFIFLK